MTENIQAIEHYVPQRPPMLLVEQLLEASHDRGVVRSVVQATWPLVVAQKVDPIVLVEVFAQSAATLAGWRNRHEGPQGGRGWLVGIRRTRIQTGPLPVGTELTTRVEVDYELDNYAVFKGSVEGSGGELAQVEIQTFRPDRDFWEQQEEA